MAHPLSPHTETITTSVGGAWPGHRAVFRGRDIHDDLVQETDWITVCAEAAGAQISSAQAQFLQRVFITTSYPDLRIWCNRVAALAGSMRSTPALAMAAANATAEAMIYGRRNEYRAASFFIRARRRLDEGASLQDCVDEHLAAEGNLAGYGRPLDQGVDERIPTWMSLAREYGLADGPYVALAFAFDEHLQGSGKPLRLNAGGLISAFGVDFGLTPEQFTMIVFPAFQAGMTPCYLEARTKPIGAIYAARCDQVEYTGVEARSWGP